MDIAQAVCHRTERDETRLMVYSTIRMRQLDALVPPTVSAARQVFVRTRYTPNGELREGRLPRVINQI